MSMFFFGVCRGRETKSSCEEDRKTEAAREEIENEQGVFACRFN